MKLSTQDILDKAKSSKRKVLTEYESKKILKLHEIPVTKEKLAKTKTEAIDLAKKIGFPVVMKIASPDIVHKTEAKGVEVGIGCVEELKQTYDKLLKNAKKYKKNARIHGITIQETAIGKEVIIGISNDVQFGHTIMFGLGGIFVEVLKDVSFRVLPIKRKDALEMIKEIQGYKLLAGARGESPVNVNAIVNTMLKVSRIIADYPQIKELDINPLFVNTSGVKAADARIVLE